MRKTIATAINSNYELVEKAHNELEDERKKELVMPAKKKRKLQMSRSCAFSRNSALTVVSAFCLSMI
jgi:hypothetical protein